MIDDPKAQKEYLTRLIASAGRKGKETGFAGFRLFLNPENLFELAASALQIFLGFGIVTISILGLFNPFWLSTFFSILGSASVIAGFFSAYRQIVSHHVFDSLVNKAIRRVIQSQN